MSVYRDTNAEVYLEHPHPGPLTATVYRNGMPIMTSDPITPVVNDAGVRVYTLELTWRETQFDGQLEIEWVGTDGILPFVRTTSVDVVTPLVPLSRLQTLFADSNWGPAELAELEEKVRVFVESYTGQSFGYQAGTYRVVGHGESRLILPRRLLKLDSVTGGLPHFFTVSTDGWQLLIRPKNYLGIKEAPPEELMDSMVMVTHGVITVPNSYWNQFRNGVEYLVQGEWGYYTVPPEIQEAALLLANDYGCGDNIYRDRYLETIKSGDWNMKFHDAAYRGTGNARADQLLNKYRRLGMVII